MRTLTQRHWKYLFLFCLVGMDLAILDLSPWMGLMLRFRVRFPMTSAFFGGAPLLWVVNGGLMVGLIGFGTYRNAARLSLWDQIVRLQKVVLPVFFGTGLLFFLIQSEVTQLRGVLFHSFVISYVLMLLGRSVLYRLNAWMRGRVLNSGEETYAGKMGASAEVYQGMGQQAGDVMAGLWGCYETTKRIIDVVGALVMIVLFSPLFIFVSILVVTTSPGPVLFRSERIGKRGKVFFLLKFRSMVHNAEEVFKNDSGLYQRFVSNGFKIVSDMDPRITRLGRFLRRTSIDEMPQFLNVIKGDISLVGPRPLLPDEIGHYRGDKRKLFSVKPGITGLWQVSGRSDLPYEERVRLNQFYIDHRSVWLDVKILLRTVLVVLKGHGAV